MSTTDEPSEESPLITSTNHAQDNGTIESQPQSGTDDATPIAEELSTKKLILTLGSIWVGVFLAALDTTIIATLSAPISNSFNSFTLMSWLASAYLIANSALQPLSGRLTDIFGRKAGLIFSNVFFFAGNLICGLAKKEWVIIFGRVVAGMGGGGLNAISSFVASDLVPLRKRGVYQGFGNICWGLGSGLGGVFGGWVNDVWGWRVAFLCQLPFILISGTLVCFTVKIPVKETDKSRLKRVDFAGAITLVITLVLLLTGLNSGGNIVPWTHPLVLAALPLSFFFLLVFIYIEDQVASEPVIPVRLLLRRTVLAACLTNWLSTMSVFALLYYGPIYFQVRGLSATQAGARLVPQAVGISFGSLGSGVVMRTTGKYYWLLLVIQSFIVISYVLIAATFNATTAKWPPFFYFFLTGIGYGGMLTTTLVSLISAVDHKYQAVITSASYAFRSTGSTIGITIASAVFQNVLNAQLWDRFGDEKHAADIIKKLRDSIEEIRNVPPTWRDGVIEAYMDALRGVWLLVLGVGILGALASALVKEHKLHTNLARR